MAWCGNTIESALRVVTGDILRRFSAKIFKIIISLIVLLALLVSALRLLMPLLNQYQVSLLEIIAKRTQTELSAAKIEGRWEHAGPVVNITHLFVRFKDGSKLQVKQINLALNIWQSLLHNKLQFKNLLFKQLKYQTPQTFPGNGEGDKHLLEIFLQRFDNFRLEDSQLQFISLSGKPVDLAIPSLTWYNDKHKHKAEGEISLSSFTGQHGSASLRLSLYEKQGKLDNGEIWLQARDVDVRPWMGQWLNDNTRLTQAQFTLTSWLRLKQGQLSSVDLILTDGTASWQNNRKRHTLNVPHVTGHLWQQDTGWQLSLPEMVLNIDGKTWPANQFALYWQPEASAGFLPSERGEVRVRANHIDIQRVSSLLPLFTRLPANWNRIWQEAKPRGILDTLALDIPLAAPNKSRFQARWHHLSFRSWQHIPAITVLNGEAAGSLHQGEVRIMLPAQEINTERQFAAPLQIKQFSANLSWIYQPQTWQLQGKKLDLSATALHAQGEFLFRGGNNVAPYLAIEANMQTDNVAEAWRYFPLAAMPQSLVHYLSEAIRGGHIDTAKLSFSGNPHEFPFKNQQGHFQVMVPLQNARFAFQPNWPELKDLDLSLNFENAGLSIHSPKLTLINGVQATDIKVELPEYSQKKLYVSAKIEGQGTAVASYFENTPLNITVGSALQQLELTGPVASDLQLMIPLDHEEIKAGGDIFLKDNQLNIQPLKTQLSGVSGRFHFLNGTLSSETMSASWLGQPVSFNFTTTKNQRLFAIKAALKTQISTDRLPQFPVSLQHLVNGIIPLEATFSIKLPHKSQVSYLGNISGNLNNVSGYLPSLLFKTNQSKKNLQLEIAGDQQQLQAKGQIGTDNQFITHWLLAKKVLLEKGRWQSKQTPPLTMPAQKGVTVDLSEQQVKYLMQNWQPIKDYLATSMKARSKNHAFANFTLPLTLSAPALALAGQTWRNVKVSWLTNSLPQPHFSVDADEISGKLSVSDHSPWVLNLAYLYYNPQHHPLVGYPSRQNRADLAIGPAHVDISTLPNIDFQCQQCWFNGQNFGKVRAKLQVARHRLVVTDGEINDGATQLTFYGDWNTVKGEQRTAVKGRFLMDEFARSAQRFGMNSPLHAHAVNLTFDLHWPNLPWQPDIQSLNGLLTLNSGKGEIDNVDTGHTGQLLRLFSMDALLRKIKMDFKDTLKKGFYFDKISATAWIEQGLLRTDNLQIDGLDANIALKGNIDLFQRLLNLEALITPAIAAPAGVATAFAINPIAGAVVYAASKILSPWWSQISLLHYSIKGPVNKPQFAEVKNEIKRSQP